MGSKGSKSRKARQPLPKVPKGEVPNTIPLTGLGGGAQSETGRLGHEHHDGPGRFGKGFLRMLGLKPKGGQAH